MKSPGLPEGCIWGLVTPENLVARQTVFTKKVLSHAAGILVSVVLETSQPQVNLLDVKSTGLIIKAGFPGRHLVLLGAGKK